MLGTDNSLNSNEGTEQTKKPSLVISGSTSSVDELSSSNNNNKQHQRVASGSNSSSVDDFLNDDVVTSSDDDDDNEENTLAISKNKGGPKKKKKKYLIQQKHDSEAMPHLSNLHRHHQHLGGEEHYKHLTHHNRTNHWSSASVMMKEQTDYGEINVYPIDIKQLQASETQVAGHGTRKKKELSLLVRDGKIFKAIQPGRKRSWSEVHFYEKQIAKAPYLLPFVPKYYGVFRAFIANEEEDLGDKSIDSLTRSSSSSLNSTFFHAASLTSTSPNTSLQTLDTSNGDVILRGVKEPLAVVNTTYKHIDFLVLEDITASMETPNVMDIKMGQRTYGEDASPEKILEEESKYPYQHVLGMRISGAKIYDRTQKAYKYLDRHWGRTITPETLMNAMEVFFLPSGYDEEVRVEIGMSVLAQFLKEVKKMYMIFTQKNDLLRMYASSLLISYDHTKNLCVKIIDFSHVHENHTGTPIFDTGFAHGLSTIISVTEQLLEKYSTSTK
ncbi:hypothetical protein C9374_005347 [Naegleria lovaniensis]|uniref:Kinase n=1 Tax=Naegleria lovaniensis TaxID=51637 RepID=A0AA88KK11_NAELO|nr:uncharacterized protein C9374_005347 [Naegleria lovaniensis]KAG2382145.1 hypothetical protein C9374_005347 [Naegleria lovaniensis]